MLSRLYFTENTFIRFRQCLYASTNHDHRFAMHLSKTQTSWLCKVGENIVMNHLQRVIVFNQRLLLSKRNLARVPDGRFGRR